MVGIILFVFINQREVYKSVHQKLNEFFLSVENFGKALDIIFFDYAVRLAGNAADFDIGNESGKQVRRKGKDIINRKSFGLVVRENLGHIKIRIKIIADERIDFEIFFF